MSQFNHAGSISSADYFGDGREDEFDITAGELMSKMSMQARQDVQHIKAAASRGARVIGEFLNELKVSIVYCDIFSLHGRPPYNDSRYQSLLFKTPASRPRS